MPFFVRFLAALAAVEVCVDDIVVSGRAGAFRCSILQAGATAETTTADASTYACHQRLVHLLQFAGQAAYPVQWCLTGWHITAG